MGIGTDVFAVKRLADAAIREEDAFSKERIPRKRRKRPELFLTAALGWRGALLKKEAVYKAVSGCGVEFHPGDVCIVTGVRGEPQALPGGKDKSALRAGLWPGLRHSPLYLP